LALGFGLGPVFARAGRGDYMQSLTPGIVTMGIFFTAVFSGVGIIWGRQFGFLKETLLAPVSRLEQRPSWIERRVLIVVAGRSCFVKSFGCRVRVEVILSRIFVWLSYPKRAIAYRKILNKRCCIG
jgi:hypothetical protein